MKIFNQDFLIFCILSNLKEELMIEQVQKFFDNKVKNNKYFPILCVEIDISAKASTHFQNFLF